MPKRSGKVLRELVDNRSEQKITQGENGEGKLTTEKMENFKIFHQSYPQQLFSNNSSPCHDQWDEGLDSLVF